MYRTRIRCTVERERSIVVALEDRITAPAVARKAALVAIAEQARRLVLLHVRDDNPAGALHAVSGYWAPVAEAVDTASDILDAAEETLRVVYATRGRPVPPISREVAVGPVAPAIERIVSAHQAAGVVLGARRPHRFGTLFHPDVGAELAAHLNCPIHVAALLHRSA